MPGVVRASSDLCYGVCYHPGAWPHVFTGIVLAGSPITDSEGLSIGRQLDMVQTTCPYNSTGIVMTSSGLTTDSGLGVARDGDFVQTPYGFLQFFMGSSLTSTD